MPIIIVNKKGQAFLFDKPSESTIMQEDTAALFVVDAIHERRLMATPAPVEKRCEACGFEPGDTWPGWEGLYGYRVHVHPNDLIVVTSASEPDMHTAIDKFTTQEGGEGNIENILRKMGHVALTGCRSKTCFEI